MYTTKQSKREMIWEVVVNDVVHFLGVCDCSQLRCMTNNRALGHYKISVELLKYAPHAVHEIIRDVLNSTVEHHLPRD